MNGASSALSNRAVTSAKSKKSTGSDEFRDNSERKFSEKAMNGANSRPKEWRRSTRRGSTGSAPWTLRQHRKIKTEQIRVGASGRMAFRISVAEAKRFITKLRTSISSQPLEVSLCPAQLFSSDFHSLTKGV